MNCQRRISLPLLLCLEELGVVDQSVIVEVVVFQNVVDHILNFRLRHRRGSTLLLFILMLIVVCKN